MATTKNYSIQ